MSTDGPTYAGCGCSLHTGHICGRDAANEIFATVRVMTHALYPEARIPETPMTDPGLVARCQYCGSKHGHWDWCDRPPPPMSRDKYPGIEIDHDSTDALSAIVENGGVTIDIGEDWAGRHHGPHRPQGFQRYTCITLTPDEATKLCDWLAGALVHLRGDHDPQPLG